MRTPLLLGSLAMALLASTAVRAQPAPVFNRIATFPVVDNLPLDGDHARKSVAEIVSASQDGRILVYTNSARDAFGFIDIADPADPKPAGEIAVEGEPTSVTVLGAKAFVAVSTSKGKKAPAGYLGIVDIATKCLEAKCGLGGQPDLIARSRDGRFVAVAIENERDEDFDNG
jgi:hypothetical protein